MGSSDLFDAAAMSAVTTYLLALIKPFVEQLPFARPDSALHDAMLRLVNLIINVVFIAAQAVSLGQFTWVNWGLYLFRGIAQAAGSHFLYTTTAATAGSSAGTGNTLTALLNRKQLIARRYGGMPNDTKAAAAEAAALPAQASQAAE